MRLRTSTSAVFVLALAGCLYVALAMRFGANVEPDNSRTAPEASNPGGRVTARARHTPDRLSSGLGESAPRVEESLDERGKTELQLSATAGARAARLAPAEPLDAERKTLDLFVEEARDSSWAGPAEERIRQELSMHLPPTTSVQTVECRAALCRVATVHADAIAYTKYLEMLKDPQARPWPADTMTLETAYDHEHVFAVSYLAREGAVRSRQN